MCFEPCFLSVVEANCIGVVSVMVEDAIFELSGCLWWWWWWWKWKSRI